VTLALQLPVLSIMTFSGMLHHLDMLKGIVLGAIFLGWCNIWTDVCIVLLILDSLSIITFHMAKTDATSAWWEVTIFIRFPTLCRIFIQYKHDAEQNTRTS
jgi:hypothetical protein